MAEDSIKALLQYKQSIIQAVRAGEYHTALQALTAGESIPAGSVHCSGLSTPVLLAAKAFAPDDPLLSELLGTIEAKVAGSAPSPSDTGEGDESEDASQTEDASTATDEETTSVDGSGEDTDTATSSGNQHDDVDSKHQPDGLSSTSGQPRTSIATLQHTQVPGDTHIASSRETADQHPGSIQLDSQCCTLSHARRWELRKQLSAAMEQQMGATALAKMLEDNPLLAGL